MADQTKVCTKCNIYKPLESFHADIARSDGRRSRCKECVKSETNHRPDIKKYNRDRQRGWRSNPDNREKARSRRKKTYKREKELSDKKRRDLNTWSTQIISNIRHRAKKQGRDFDLVASDIVVPEICPVLGIPLMSGAEAPLHNRPSVDRFDNDRGYTKDNIRVISYRANQLKRDATVDEIRRILHYMEGDVS